MPPKPPSICWGIWALTTTAVVIDASLALLFLVWTWRVTRMPCGSTEASVASNELAVLETQLRPLAPHFAQVLGKTMPVERLMRTVMISVERLPMLLTCDRQSIFNAAMSAACLGLEVDGVTGQAYLIPFKGRAQLVIGYKGYNTMAARSGITITGKVVREGDDFDYDLAEGWVKHKKHLSVPKGKIIAALSRL